MKAVLISIRPEWCEKIASGRKTMELRKTYPKNVKVPFKCLIYCTKGAKNRLAESQMKVIGEFTCDGIMRFCQMQNADLAEQQSLVRREDIFKYSGEGEHEVYGWHISDLKIYDKPKELGEFVHPCERENCRECKYGEAYHGAYGDVYYACCSRLERPPQSWCYMKEVP